MMIRIRESHGPRSEKDSGILEWSSELVVCKTRLRGIAKSSSSAEMSLFATGDPCQTNVRMESLIGYLPTPLPASRALRSARVILPLRRVLGLDLNHFRKLEEHCWK